MAQIYLGEVIQTGQLCAIKSLPDDAPDFVQNLELLGKEARIISQLNHPNIVRGLDFYLAEACLVMEYIDGKEVDYFIKIAKSRSPRNGWRPTRGATR